MKAATIAEYVTKFDYCISIHAAREGGDYGDPIYYDGNYISIHAAREGGDHIHHADAIYNLISIHAAREGGDVQDEIRQDNAFISIHAAREGGDKMQRMPALCMLDFNPRRP